MPLSIPRKHIIWRITYTYQRYANMKPITKHKDVLNIIGLGGAIKAVLLEWPTVNMFTVQKIEYVEETEVR